MRGGEKFRHGFKKKKFPLFGNGLLLLAAAAAAAAAANRRACTGVIRNTT